MGKPTRDQMMKVSWKLALALAALSAGADALNIRAASKQAFFDPHQGIVGYHVQKVDCTETQGRLSETAQGICGCAAGYDGTPRWNPRDQVWDASTCTNINECGVMNGGCDDICTDTVGSFTCSCNPGRELGADGKRCNPCQKLNVESYSSECTVAMCDPGYTVNSDGDCAECGLANVLTYSSQCTIATCKWSYSLTTYNTCER